MQAVHGGTNSAANVAGFRRKRSWQDRAVGSPGE